MYLIIVNFFKKNAREKKKEFQEWAEGWIKEYLSHNKSFLLFLRDLSWLYAVTMVPSSLCPLCTQQELNKCYLLMFIAVLLKTHLWKGKYTVFKVHCPHSIRWSDLWCGYMLS